MEEYSLSTARKGLFAQCHTGTHKSHCMASQWQ